MQYVSYILFHLSSNSKTQVLYKSEHSITTMEADSGGTLVTVCTLNFVQFFIEQWLLRGADNQETQLKEDRPAIKQRCTCEWLLDFVIWTRKKELNRLCYVNLRKKFNHYLWVEARPKIHSLCILAIWVIANLTIFYGKEGNIKHKGKIYFQEKEYKQH